MSSLQNTAYKSRKTITENTAAYMIIIASKRRENTEKHEKCQMSDSPESRDDDATQGKTRAQVPQVPADDQRVQRDFPFKNV